MSNAELYICQILTKGSFKFQQEKTFEDLRNGRFRYDFYVINVGSSSGTFKGSDGAPLCFPLLLEFDGPQHFQQVKKFQQNRMELNKTKGYDRRKNNYALANSIPLYRVPYWELDNIKSALDLFQEKFLVKSQYHNDEIWNEYQLNN